MFSTKNPVLSIHEVLPTELLCLIGLFLTILELVPLSETCVGLRDVYRHFVISEKKKNILYLPEITEYSFFFREIKKLIISSRESVFLASLDYSRLIPYLYLKGTLRRKNRPAFVNGKLHRENPENPEKREKREKRETKKHIRKLENIQKNYLNKKATTKKEKRKT